MNAPTGLSANATFLACPLHPHGVAWQVGIKAGRSHGIAPDAITSEDTDLPEAIPPHMPDWRYGRTTYATQP